MLLDHRVASNAEHVGVAAGREHIGDGHRLRGVLVGLDRAAGRDLADHRQHVRLRGHCLRHELMGQAELDRSRRGEADGTRLGGAALEEAIALEHLQVVVNRRRRAEADRQRDLAH